LNISNDAWFLGTSEHDEHLAISRFRAVECRRSLARSVNMGISAVIDPNGRVLRPETVLEFKDKDSGKTRIWEIAANNKTIAELPVSRWAEFKKVSGLLLADMPIDHRSSLYSRWGDWFPWTCWAIIGLALAASLFRKPVRFEKDSLCP
jgi:apolipoprotein N-acyltransferase